MLNGFLSGARNVPELDCSLLVCNNICLFKAEAFTLAVGLSCQQVSKIDRNFTSNPAICCNDGLNGRPLKSNVRNMDMISVEDRTKDVSFLISKELGGFGLPALKIQNLYLDSSCCTHTEEGNTSYFTIDSSMRQWRILSPFLFLLVIDFVMQKATDRDGLGILWQEPNRLMDLDFVDDIALLGARKKSTEDMTTSLEREAANIGLWISGNKTKIMRIGYAVAIDPVTIGQQQVEEIDKFSYLDSILKNDGNADHDLASRTGKAGAVFRRLKPIWLTPKINIVTKIRLLNTIVFPTTIYPYGTWKTPARIVKRLNVAQQQWLRQIL
uniref:Reverse transcriptase domain-containing protein n=1 Tax=Romanomermis culicivorax TaxID=13658 RepID=A0A915KPL7_ROMCU